MMLNFFARFCRDDQAQDLTEYTLLLAMVSLVIFALMASTGQTAAGIWTGANSSLASANVTASSS
jgi:Flp pilus assembly pilin Flp